MSAASQSRLSNKRLLLKLFALMTLMISIGIAARWYLIEYMAADYFSALLQKYGIPGSPSLTDAFMEAARRDLLWAHVISVITGLAVALMLVKIVLDPLNRVIAVTRKVAAGDFTTRVPPSWDDEIGELGKAFNSMTANLQRTEELRRKMVVDIAHEVRAPLTNIRGYLEALSSGALASTPAIVESLNEEALRLSNLTDSMLRLSVADAARSGMQKAQGDLRKLIEQSLTLYQEHLSGKSIAVSTRFTGPTETITADFDKLAQVIQNLLENAWRYTPVGGYLRIRGERSPGALKVVFTTSGEPIGEEHLAHIFERFYRVDRSRSREVGSAGIGLAIVKELVEAHGGSVGAETSQDENSIWLTLPTT